MENNRIKTPVNLFIILVAVVLTLVGLAVSVNAATSGDYEYTVSNGEATITKYIGSGGDVTIPSKLGGYPVTSIGGNAFIRCTSLTSVSVPDSVEVIGGNAFRSCTSLRSVVIPDSVKRIGAEAFNNTAYYNAESNWPNQVLYIGHHLIKAKTSMSGMFSIRTGTVCIADYALEGCTSITRVTIPDGVTRIGASAFKDCTALKSITIPNSVTSIGWEAFWKCTSLTSVSIPESVEIIESNVFRYCTSLTSVVIPGSVTSIEGYAFKDCTVLKNITIPDSVTIIGDYVFENTAYYDNKANWVNDVLYIGHHLIGTNTSISGSYSIRTGTLCIAGSAFKGCSFLTSVTIPDSVMYIGNSAFSGCTSLTSITIPDSVTSIERWTFGDCTSLTSVTIPNSVTSIGGSAFSNCASLTSIAVPDSVTSIDVSAFRDCTSLKNITIPESVTSIDIQAFWGCSSLTDITIPTSVTSIKMSVFLGCTSLKNITIPESVTSIDAQAFSDCTSLTNITIPDSVTSIGKNAFNGCTSLTSVTIPDSVTSIGDFAFYNCTSLTSVTIGDGVTSIGERAFEGCTSLIDAKIGNNVKTISKELFKGCNSLRKVSFGKNVNTIGTFSFSNCTSLQYVFLPHSLWSIERYAFYKTGRLTVYYSGSSVDWKKIRVNHESTNDYGSSNSAISDATFIFEYHSKDLLDYVDYREATCYEDGTIGHWCCLYCGKKFSDENGNNEIFPWTTEYESLVIPALGHDWDDGVTTLPATVEQEGVKAYNCIRCGETKTEVIPKLTDTTQIFADVQPGKWYTDAVNYVYSNGLMNGMTETTFAPNDAMSRAMLVTVLWRAEGSPEPASATPFTDLKSKWYKDAVAWAYENGIVNGMTATTFGPDASITREQIATIIYRYAEFRGDGVSARASITSFPDASKVSKWAKDALSWAVAEGLISGTKSGNTTILDPKGNATRAQVATILMRYLEK